MPGTTIAGAHGVVVINVMYTEPPVNNGDTCRAVPNTGAECQMLRKLVIA
jgi:hypothetical protein